MKNKAVIIFLIILSLIVVAIIVGDFKSTRPDKQGENPFDLNVNEYRDVAPELITYKETKNFKLDFEELDGLDVSNQYIYIAGDSVVQVIDFNGQLVKEIVLKDDPYCIAVSENQVYVGNENTVFVFSLEGELLTTLGPFTENSVITSIDAYEEHLFIADAGARRVYHFVNLEKINDIEGKTGEEALHGFIIPSPYFDVKVNSFGDLWVVNPGKHALENYSFEGDLRSNWTATAIQIEGFSGCCNPAHFTFLEDGSFITSEKGLVRIKIYEQSGKFKSVVAAPNKFKEDGHAPDIAADSAGNIYALDFDSKMVRVFELK